MRIIGIKNNQAIVQLDPTELDRIVNDYLDLQYAIGYDEGYNDWARACNDADVDDDNPKEE